MEKNKRISENEDKIYLFGAIVLNFLLISLFFLQSSYLLTLFLCILFITVNVGIFYYILNKVDVLIVSLLITFCIFAFFIGGYYKHISKNELNRSLYDNGLTFRDTDILIQDPDTPLQSIEIFIFISVCISIFLTLFISAKLPDKIKLGK